MYIYRSILSLFLYTHACVYITKRILICVLVKNKNTRIILPL